MPFIEVVTRCYKRPKMLAENTASLDRQTFTDWEQTLLIDEVGIGLDQANAQLADFVPVGDYVWILDDDEIATRDSLFEEVYNIVNDTGADYVMVKMDHGFRGILPLWQREPMPGAIGVSAAFIRRDVWEQCAHCWRKPGYMTDGQFMTAAFNAAERVEWHDVIGSMVQKISLGAPE